MKTVDKVAFTLVELMVVIGLMALLGTFSVTGYFAAVRGMSDRAALDDTRSLIRLAMQTCLIDQTPTAVLFYNHQNQVQTDAVSSEEVKATSSGSAIAIKMAGRISYIDGNILVDEFADWDQSYPHGELKKKDSYKPSTFFYNMMNLDDVAKGIDHCRDYVTDVVLPVDFKNEYMIASGCQVYGFCQKYRKNPDDNEKFSGTSYPNGNNQRWGRRSGGKITWNVGDAYGVEIAKLDLPKGYIFGNQEPNSLKVKQVPSLSFVPSDASKWSDDLDKMKLDNSVTISAFRGERFRSIGSLNASDLKDDAK